MNLNTNVIIYNLSINLKKINPIYLFQQQFVFKKKIYITESERQYPIPLESTLKLNVYPFIISKDNFLKSQSTNIKTKLKWHI